MPFCPKCRCEYNKRGISECPYCGASLVDRQDDKTPQPVTAGERHGDDLLCLRSFPSCAYALMLQGALENEGIASTIKRETGEISPADLLALSDQLDSGGVTIWVPKKDYRTSKEIADQMFDDI
jgi:hypothetical protein